MSKNISNETIDLIIRSSNIVNIIGQFIQLTKKGNNYLGVCPFHADTSPSLTVSESKNIYKCFACGHSGNVVKFVKEFKNISFMQALEFLAKEANLQINFDSFKTYETPRKDPNQQKLFDLLEAANLYFKLNVSNLETQKFLDYRKLNDAEILETFDIGYAPLTNYLEILKTNNLYSDLDLNNVGLINDDLNLIFKNRVTFAIKNEFGEVVGFSGRQLNNDKSYAKYLNSPESLIFKKSKILYNFHNAKETAMEKHSIIIVEGFMDVIALYKSGFKNVIALMGTALTDDHLKLLNDLKVILFLDNDTAGQSATYKSLLKLIKHKFEVEVVVNKFNKDPDEILHTNGKEFLIELIENSRKRGEHVLFENLKKQYHLNNFNVDINSVNFGLFKRNLIQLFQDAPYSSRELIETRFKEEFNTNLILQNFPKDSSKSINTLVPKVNASKRSYFSLEKSLIYGNVKLEILLTCLANYQLRNLINEDIKSANEGKEILNTFSIMSNLMYSQSVNEVNLKTTFEEILNLDSKYEYSIIKENDPIIESIKNKINRQITSFYANLNPEYLDYEINDYLKTHLNQIQTITPENFNNNLYIKYLKQKLELKLTQDYRNLVKKVNNNGEIPKVVLDLLPKIKTPEK
ncbi:DNA primase [Mycoplasmopsis columboralis]|uniref:DNA primase n=1 Tax=Mycoplasmopsis columboralis TaxID=171282 RepID=A0A449B5Y3_9BACT|nr:DNA primase [Mycoplasmopsis columboralis]VEU76011.1 DNA primase [Mycoplasmopsis columboralis]